MDKPTLPNRLKKAWNAFLSREPTKYRPSGGVVTSYSPFRQRYIYGDDQTIISAIYNRIAMDCAATTLQHIRKDDNGRFKEVVDSHLNYCLTVEANIDQTGRSFIQDAVESLLEEGWIALLPVDTDSSVFDNDSFAIYTLRVGRVIQWFPDAVTIRAYNDQNGQLEDITMPKRSVGLVPNPFFDVMNRPNSILQRLIHKLALLDAVDEQSGAGKLDLIIQLPYVVKSAARKEQAEKRRKEIEDQLAGSKYGIAYTDGTEKITQLNRSLENNLMSQIQYLTSMLYSQLGITTGILDGTASDAEMLNYKNRVVEPIIAAIVDEMNRKFLTKTARSQNQTIFYFNDPFRLVPVSQLADIADKFTRNEIMSPNEMRQIVGMKPSAAPEADELRNRNINQSDGYKPVYADSEDEPIENTELKDATGNAKADLMAYFNSLHMEE